MAVFTHVTAYGPTLEAGEDLAAGDNVCVADADGLLYKADSNDDTRRPCIGAVDVAVSDGEDAAVILAGRRNDGTSLKEGRMIYLSATPGAETQTGNTGVQAIGIAYSTTEWYFAPQLAYGIPTA